MKIKDLLQPLKLHNKIVEILDQRKLPLKEEYMIIRHPQEMIEAIQSLAIRGAPLLGLAGLAGTYLSTLASKSCNEHREWMEKIAYARPTAVQLSEIVLQAHQKFGHLPLQEQSFKYFEHTTSYWNELYQESEKIATKGQALLPEKISAMTHCNTGSLAMGGWGTALGILLYAFLVKNKSMKVYYTETRPLQQGLRLTGYELAKYDIPSQCIVDSASAFIMSQGLVNIVITGADRIALNGDTANKIGTFPIAIAAKHHHIPFYIAAPCSTFDLKAKSGKEFSIEHRSMNEINLCPSLIEPNPFFKLQGINPAFDVTPFSLISGYITERGVLTPPFLF